jgi:hypothetical protein
MRKNPLATAIVAGFAGAAGLASVALAQTATSRMYLNADGLGQVLIYPYYTVNDGNATLISVVNTTGRTKAVKVRFLEGRNSREVLDFNLYLSPFDVWTASLTDIGNATGPGVLRTTDTSCTVPNILNDFGGEVPFRNFQYAGTSLLTQDDGPNGLERTREGYVEMIEMGEVVDDNSLLDLAPNDYGLPAAARNRFSSAATHNAGVPNDCDALTFSWTPGLGDWATDTADVDLLAPRGGLFGSASIVDVAFGTNLSYNADAIDGFFQNQGTRTLGDGRVMANTLHTEPGSLLPSLANGRTAAGQAVAEVLVNGSAVAMSFPANRAIGAVSSVFMYDAIYNEFVTSSALGASSEWVVTFPTKRQHIDRLRYVPGDVVTLQQYRPFTDWTDATGDGLVFDTTGSCEIIAISGLTPANAESNTQGGIFRDREEGPAGTPGNVEFSPRPPGASTTLSLCYEAQVVAFNQTNVGEGFNASQVLGSTYARNLNLRAGQTAIPAGWVKMKLGQDSLTDPNNLGNTRGNFLPDGVLLQLGGTTDKTGTRLYGLPATGFWALKVEQGAGNVANYSGLWRHRGSRRTAPNFERVRNSGFIPGTTCTDTITGAVGLCPNNTDVAQTTAFATS